MFFANPVSAKAGLIADKLVHDVTTGKEVTLKSLFPLYSPEWERDI